MELKQLVESLFCKDCVSLRTNGKVCPWLPHRCHEFDGVLEITKRAQLEILDGIPGEPMRAGIWIKDKLREVRG